jgi:peptidoglycan LD-endopeptidase LytH
MAVTYEDIKKIPGRFIPPRNFDSTNHDELRRFACKFLPPLDYDFSNMEIMDLDLSVGNSYFEKFDKIDNSIIEKYIVNKLKEQVADIAIGGYGEDRAIYRKSTHFGKGEDARTIHLGIDLWCQAGTKVLAPFQGKVHSFADNSNFGDYGPTVILEHEIPEGKFYTLYGHLSKKSLESISEGKYFKTGEPFAEIGDATENGNWPPHLHFQLILDMSGKSGDFPGVASAKDKDYFLKVCPNPNIFIKAKSDGFYF